MEGTRIFRHETGMLAASRPSRMAVAARILAVPPRANRAPAREVSVKKLLGIFAIAGAAIAAIMFWKSNQDDDEFLDEELE